MPPEPKAPTRFTLALPQPVNRVCICGRQALSSGWCPRCERSYGDAAWSQVARKPKPQKPKKVKVHKIVGDSDGARRERRKERTVELGVLEPAREPLLPIAHTVHEVEDAPPRAPRVAKGGARKPPPRTSPTLAGLAANWKRRAAEVRTVVVRELERDPDLTAAALLATVEAETQHKFASLDSFRHVYVRDAKNRLSARKRLAESRPTE